MPKTPQAGRAWSFDPQDWMASVGGYIQPTYRSLTITYEVLRLMARVPPFAAIIQTRCNQVAEFSKRQESPYQQGFRVILRDRKRTPTPVEQKAIDQMEEYYAYCGVIFEPTDLLMREPFETFLRKLVRDSLALDQACFEILPDRLGRPAAFQAVDAGTIRWAAPNDKDPATNPLQRKFCQVIREQIVADWDAGEMVMGIRRPRTDLGSNGYGYSELEELVQIVTAWLYGFDYNMNYFRQGSAIKGFMKVKGLIPEPQFEAMKRQWLGMVEGHQNAWRTPWINVPTKDDDVEFQQLQLTNDEMQFDVWMGWLLKFGCAVYQMDPMEVGFKFGNEGGGGLFEKGNVEERIRRSRAKGLSPMLRSLEYWFNTHITWLLNPDLELTFAGLDTQDEQDRVNLDKERVKTQITLNELRAEKDQPPLPWGDVILDSVALEAKLVYDALQGIGREAMVDDRLSPGQEKTEEKKDREAIARALLDRSPILAKALKERQLRQGRRLIDFTV